MQPGMKKIIAKLLLLPLAVAVFVSLYFFISIIFSIIPVGKPIAKNNPVEIFISFSEVHSDFIVPVKSETVEWLDIIDKNQYPYFKNILPEYISFGWGDKGFYLNTPGWDDLTFSTAFIALFSLSESVVHVNLLQTKPREYSSCVKITLTENQYSLLIQYILHSFKMAFGKPILFSGKSYSGSDNFYQARGHYTLFYTCNTWVNEGLKKINVKTAFWTPYGEGIKYHLRED